MTDANYVHLALVVDRSGSMQGIHDDMNGGIDKLLTEQSESGLTVKVDVCTFDSVVEFVATDAEPSSIIGKGFCHPRGSTALNDAIGQTINRLGNKFKTLPEEKRPGAVIVVIITDGMENASREFSVTDVKRLVTQQTDEWGWTFSYLAANVDAFSTGGGYGFNPGQTLQYVASAGGTANTWDAASANVTRVAKGNTTGYLQSERDAATEE